MCYSPIDGGWVKAEYNTEASRGLKIEEAEQLKHTLYLLRPTSTLSEPERHTVDAETGPLLRRVSTEERQDSRRLSSHSLQLWAYGEDEMGGTVVDQSIPTALYLLGPSLKSSISGPSTTHAEVQVLNELTPKLPDYAVGLPAALLTPVRSTAQSKHGLHELEWVSAVQSGDGQDPKEQIREVYSSRPVNTRHSRSCIGGLAVPALERVNTKLAAWSWIGNEGDNEDKNMAWPNIQTPNPISYRQPKFRLSEEDDEKLPIKAPPNSLKPSRPASIHPSSSEMLADIDLPFDYGSSSSASQEERGKESIGNRLGIPIGISRTLSNVSGQEIGFRNHRDSVSLSRQRWMLKHRG